MKLIGLGQRSHHLSRSCNVLGFTWQRLNGFCIVPAPHYGALAVGVFLGGAYGWLGKRCLAPKFSKSYKVVNRLLSALELLETPFRAPNQMLSFVRMPRS